MLVLPLADNLTSPARLHLSPHMHMHIAVILPTSYQNTPMLLLISIHIGPAIVRHAFGVRRAYASLD
jgi:hypothetical protein